MLTADELACLQCGEGLPFPERVEVLRDTSTSDDAGGHTTTPSVVATVRGMLSPGGTQAGEPVMGERLAGVARWTVTVPGGTDVRRTDQLRVLGRTFEVVHPGGPRSFEVIRRVDCIEIT